MTIDLGEMKKVDAANVWEHEEWDFTPGWGAR
jgi:hypothetical protein